MLLAIRDRVTGFLAWAVVILISIVFVFWGVSSYVGSDQVQYAVKVNGEEASLREYDRLLTQNRQQMLQSFGGRMPAYFSPEPYLRQQSLEQLINRELFTQFLEKYRFRVPAQQILDSITSDSRFQSDGKFKPELYDRELLSRGVSKQVYEIETKQEIEARQLEAGLLNTAIATKQEISEFAKLKHQARTFEFVQFALADQKKQQTNISEEDIKAYYNDPVNQTRFVTEEEVKVEYLELSLQELASNIIVDEEELKQEYEEGLKQGRYQSEEIRKASHILIKIPNDASAEAVAEKEAEITALREQIVAGGSFEDIAKEKSEDPGSAAQGGSLGDVRRGVMVKPFEDALFALEANVISEPVRSPFGFHLIRVDSIQASVKRPYEEVSEQLEKDYRNRKADPIFYDRLDTLETLAYENPDLTDAAAAIESELLQSDWFTGSKGDEKDVTQYPEVRAVAFEEEILDERHNSAAIEVGSEHVVFIRVVDHKPSGKQELEAAKDSIVEELKTRQAKEALTALADQALEQAQSGTELESVAKKSGGQYQNKEKLKRTASGVPNEILQAVFRLPLPSEENKAIEKISLNNGDAAILRLTQVNDGDFQWLSDEEKQQDIKQILQQRGQFDLAALFAAFRADSEVIINEELQKQNN